MKKVLFLISVLACSFVLNAETGLGEYEKAVFPHDIKASEWWQQTYQEGKRYITNVGYNFNLNVRISNSEDGKFLARQIKNFIKNNIYCAHFAGTDSFFSENISWEGKTLKMARYYGLMASERNISINPDDNVKPLIEMVATDKVFQNIINKVSFATCFKMPWLSASLQGIRKTAEKIGLADEINEAYKKFLKDKIADPEQMKKDGILCIDLKNDKNWLKMYLTPEQLKNIENLAMKLDEEFSRGWFYLEKDGSDNVYVFKRPEKESFNTLKGVSFSKENGFEPASNFVNGTIQRESFAINSDITGCKNRKIGESWVVDSKFMNSFLHPDFRGGFHGNIILTYKMDRDDYIQKTSGEKVSVRVIQMRRGYLKQNGIIYTNNATYEESNFKANLNSADSDVELFIDKKTGYLVCAKVNICAGAESQLLPDIPLAKGLIAESRPNIELYYEMNVSE